jgi:hypothetical protein
MTDQENTADDPKIIVDEDWKSQVENEKEQLRQQESGDATPDASEPDQPPIPPASFSMHLSTLATQAMASMGVLPDPSTGKPNVNRPLAKHFVDTISMLEEKTKGNLTEEEASQIRDALHQLRMAFVATGNQPTATPEPKSSIELP